MHDLPLTHSRLLTLNISFALLPPFFLLPHPREYKPDGGMHWQQVTSFEKNKFYIHGNLELFRNLTGWKGSRVLYFGDHVYADLADAAMQHGWRTAAIIPEIENEVQGR